jgi:hypothetical protein
MIEKGLIAKRNSSLYIVFFAWLLSVSCSPKAVKEISLSGTWKFQKDSMNHVF